MSVNQTTVRNIQPSNETSAANEPQHFDHPHKIMLGLYISVFLGMLSETSMNITLPDLMTDFGISSGTAQWMVVGYMLAIGVVLPCVGFMLKWVKAKTLVLFALACFLIGAIVCTVAPTFPILLAGRIMQGVSTGIALPTMYAAIMRVFPPHRIGAANGVAGLVIMFAPVIGPTIAGALIGAFSWRAIFALFALVAVIAIVCTALFFVTPIERTRPRVDVVSILASAIGFGCLVAGVSLISDMGFSAVVIGLLVVGVIVLAFYAHRQLTIDDPLLDLRALGIAAFRTPAIMISCSFSCTLAFMYLVPQELQRGMGLSSTVAGLLMLPGGVINALCTLAAGRMFDRYGAKRLVWAGAVLSLIGGVLFCMIGVSTPVALFLAAHIIVMVGIPFIQQSAQSAALKSLPGRMAADGSTIMNTMQQVCGAIATAVATCLLGLGQANYTAAGGTNPSQGFVDGSRYGYLFGMALVAVVLVLSFLLKEHHEEPRLVPVSVTADMPVAELAM
ncbi:DHA2 family efflux MFS transporter permease subunit [Bifidobacterium aerophilum]|uniref:DHA2 family efflux MFS transporter permease subunit n=1 Tax=Bifidobacterium aerophilum TaxID=1798155 RepID=A0A6N9Z5Y2_9BIFI|nr:DHA2 family efflux MFS transporter permease subunit [Bifidobacterium aerophilum]NEG89764.1 DHA2 family efflux MFS transporter permease subunit [Bifidobacterium aerophilum]